MPVVVIRSEAKTDQVGMHTSSSAGSISLSRSVTAPWSLRKLERSSLPSLILDETEGKLPIRRSCARD